MPDVVRQVETQFTVMDKATAPLRAMQGAAARITSAFDKASNTLGTFGGLAAAAAGGFSVATSIAGANQYLRTVRDIGEATGYAFTEVDGILEAMQKVNVSAMEAQNAITVMAVKQARVRMEIERTGKAQSDSARIIQAMGVTAEMGPEESFKRMAKLAQQNKLGISDLVIGFEMERNVATKLIRLLQQGPEAITATMDSLRKRGIAVTAQNVEAFAKFEQAQIGIRSAWDRIFIVVANKVYPIVTRLMDKVADRLDDWSASAGEWGKTIAEWLENHYRKLILIGKVMAANFAMQKVMGFGFAGAGSRIGAAGRGLMTRGAGIAGEGATTMQALFAGIKSMNPLVIAISGGVAAAALAARAFNRNVMGLGDSIRDIFSRIEYLLQPTIMALERIELIDPGGIFSQIADILGGVLLKPIELYLRYSELFIKFVRTIATVLGQYPSLIDAIWIGIKRMLVKFYNANVELINKITFGRAGLEKKAVPEAVGGETLASRFERVWGFLGAEADAAAKATRVARDAEEKRTMAGGRVPGEREKQPYNDFRGSRFDIKQSFAEGFDPDRIAVAFANDLATLGEQRVQSALAPVGVVR